MRRSMRKRGIRQRPNRHWLIPSIMLLIMLVVIWSVLYVRDTGTYAPEETPQSSPTASADQGDEYAELREQLDKFVVLYNSPPSKRNNVELKALAFNDDAYSSLDMESLLSSEAGKGDGVSATTVKLAPKSKGEFNVKENDDFAVVTSETVLLISRPDEEPYTTTKSYTSIWKERSFDGWTFVAFLSSE